MLQALQADLSLDFSSLKRQYRATGRAERDQLDDQFRKDIEERGAQLARLVPNLKAIEQYEAVKVRTHPYDLMLPLQILLLAKAFMLLYRNRRFTGLRK